MNDGEAHGTCAKPEPCINAQWTSGRCIIV